MGKILELGMNLLALLPDFYLASAFLREWISPASFGPTWAVRDANLLLFMDVLIIGFYFVEIQFFFPDFFGRKTVTNFGLQIDLTPSNERIVFFCLLFLSSLLMLVIGKGVTHSSWPFTMFIALIWRKRRALALHRASSKSDIERAFGRELGFPAIYWCLLVMVVLLAAFAGAVPDLGLTPNIVANRYPGFSDPDGVLPKVMAFGFLYFLGWGLLAALALFFPDRNPLTLIEQAVMARSQEQEEALIAETPGPSTDDMEKKRIRVRLRSSTPRKRPPKKGNSV